MYFWKCAFVHTAHVTEVVTTLMYACVSACDDMVDASEIVFRCAMNIEEQSKQP